MCIRDRWGADSTQTFSVGSEGIAACATLTMDGSSAILGCNTGEVVVLDLERMESTSTMGGSGPDVLSVVAHRTLPLVMSARSDGSIVCFDLRSGKEAKRITGAHNGAVRALDLDSSGLLLASGGDDCEMKIWDIGRWEQLESHCAHVGGGVGCGVMSAVFHPEKRVLASAGADAIVHVYHQGQ
eukprot:TRINITY_DN44227_c0_g1_i1.p1 TRINITY_DN44227_c0_g1~~TRINITY_DN44227_c0_g1_i1.p1  ORF type:complete len:201 (+),score=11.27 TRINITY_DN44227_c0_g1_i1:54-605(+)